MRGVLTSSASVGLLGEEFLNLLGEVPLGAPDEPDHAEHHKNGDEAEPEWLLEHALTQADDVGGRVWGFTPVKIQLLIFLRYHLFKNRSSKTVDQHLIKNASGVKSTLDALADLRCV